LSLLFAWQTFANCDHKLALAPVHSPSHASTALKSHHRGSISGFDKEVVQGSAHSGNGRPRLARKRWTYVEDVEKGDGEPGDIAEEDDFDTGVQTRSKKVAAKKRDRPLSTFSDAGTAGGHKSKMAKGEGKARGKGRGKDK
jgi:hypothetical protein